MNVSKDSVKIMIDRDSRPDLDFKPLDLIWLDIKSSSNQIVKGASQVVKILSQVVSSSSETACSKLFDQIKKFGETQYLNVKALFI